MIPFNLILVTVTSLAVFFDVRFRRIPNGLILFGVAAGLILNFYRSPTDVYYSVIAFVIGIGIFYVPFLFGWIGAGDVKYAGMIGAILGIRLLFRALFYASLSSGVMAVASVLLGNFRIGVLKTTWIECRIAALTLGHVLPESVRTRVSQGGHSLPWGVALGAGTILAYFVDREGYWAGF